MSTRIRPAAGADYDDFARLFVELAIPDPTPSRERFEGGIVPDAFVAVSNVDGHDVVSGLLWCRRRGLALHVVYVITSPLVRRQGVGTALMAKAKARAQELCLERWYLNVKPDNVAAIALYERSGMRASMASASVRIAVDDVVRVDGDSGDVVVGALDDGGDDDGYERALGLDAGELAAGRALPGRKMFGATRAGAPVGVVGFDAAFPGLSPVVVADVGVARTFLDVVVRDPALTKPSLSIFVEGNAALEDALVAAGGEVTLRITRMEGHVSQT